MLIMCLMLLVIVGEQDEAGGVHREGLWRGRGAVVDVRHPGETDPRVQAPAAEHSAHHHPLQPAEEEPQHAVRAADDHDGRQGGRAHSLSMMMDDVRGSSRSSLQHQLCKTTKHTINK